MINFNSKLIDVMLRLIDRVALLLLVVFFVFITLVDPALAQDNRALDLTLSQKNANLKLHDRTDDLQLTWNDVARVPSFIRIKNLNITWKSDSTIQRTYQFIDEYKDLFQIKEPDQELQFIQQSTDDLGMQHVTLQQMHQGVPVYASRLVFHFNASGDITSINGMYLPNLSNTNSTAQISKNDAVTIAKNNVKKQLVQSEVFFDELNLKEASSQLVYYNHGLFSKKKEETYLTWRVSVYSATSALNQLFYIDATNGEVINQLDNLPSAQDRETYVFADCLDYTGTLTYDETGLVATYDDQAETVHEYASQIYDYYNDNFGRDSYDSLGSVLQSYTHYELWDSELWIPGCVEVANAFWDPERNIMFYGENYLSLDVAAHETTHGVIQYSVGTTDEDTLEYVNESGALNESYADIFGELVEFDSGGGDWLHGTDLSDGPNRDFSNPNRGAYDRANDYNASSNYGQPSHIDEKAEITDPICDSLVEDDHGCIHLNSGIFNNAFYLLVEGGTNVYSGVTVAGGVPREAAEQIYYRALTTYLDTASDFTDAYNATMQACLDLNASDSTTYPISYCESVFDAFAAVGINTDISYAWANISASSTSGTAPLAITFDAADSMTINSTIATYAWDFGDGSSDTTGAVSHTFTDPGTYVVTLTVTDSNGVTGTASTTITVYASGTISTDTTWLAERSPYVVAGSLSVSTTATLTIEPGVVVKFYSTDSSLSVGGTVDAQGTEANPIVFTSYYDDEYGGDTNNDDTSTTPAAGDWYYMYFASVSTATLDYVTIRYGGTTDYSTDYPMLMLYSSSNTLSNSMISDSEYHAVGLSGNPILTSNTISTTPNSYYGITMSSDSPTITNNTFTDNKCAVYVSGTATPILTNNTFTGNQYAIYLGALNSGIILTGNDGSDNSINGIIVNASTAGDIEFNTDNELPYVLSAATVSSGDTLTIVPGTVIKFYTASYGTYSAWSAYLSVFGTLIAEGTTTDPIIFTSINDDDYGGDTNNNGTASSPIAGDWEALSFVSTSTANISHAYIQYGGGRASGSSINSPMVYINSDNVTLSESNITNSDYYSVSIYNASPTITNSTIQSSDSRGVNISGGSTILTGNVITDHPYGVYTSSGATPTLFNNLIYDNTYGLYNADSAVTVSAEYNWWGDASGPYNASTNPSGLGDTASSYIDFDPWLTSEDYTPPSDVTLGTIRKDVWTPSVTLSWTNPADSDFDHIQIDRIDVAAGTTTTLSSTESGTSYSDTTPSYNRIYTYTLYACDTSSNCSTGVTTASQRLRNPAPTNLILTSGDTTITAIWAASSAPTTTLGGYKVYYGTSAGALTTSLDVGNVTTTTLTSLTNGIRYYVAVTAYSRTGVESARSTIRAARPRP